jgi:hypothetical protein
MDQQASLGLASLDIVAQNNVIIDHQTDFETSEEFKQLLKELPPVYSTTKLKEEEQYRYLSKTAVSVTGNEIYQNFWSRISDVSSNDPNLVDKVKVKGSQWSIHFYMLKESDHEPIVMFGEKLRLACVIIRRSTGLARFNAVTQLPDYPIICCMILLRPSTLFDLPNSETLMVETHKETFRKHLANKSDVKKIRAIIKERISIIYHSSKVFADNVTTACLLAHLVCRGGNSSHLMSLCLSNNNKDVRLMGFLNGDEIETSTDTIE